MIYLKGPWFSLVNENLNLTHLFEVYSMLVCHVYIPRSLMKFWNITAPSPSKQVILAGPRNMPQRYDTFAFLDAVVGRLQTLPSLQTPQPGLANSKHLKDGISGLEVVVSWLRLLVDRLYKLKIVGDGPWRRVFQHLRYMKWLQNLGPIVDTLKMNRDE